MKRAFLLPLLALLLNACASLPAITPPGADAAAIESRCGEVFPRRAWHMVHAITTDLPGRRKGVMLGVVSLVPDEQAVECALLSIEGLRLFEARDDGTLTIRRALPPFDRPELAQGMMQDIRLLFFPPPGPPLASGTWPSGETGCRYALEEGYQDIVRRPAGDVVIQRYDHHGRRVRRAELSRCHPDGAAGLEAVPCRIRLEAFRPAAYRLELELVEARPTEPLP